MKEKPEIEKMCICCEHSTSTYDNSYVICSKKGVVHASYICRKFLYDPLKRTVKKPPKQNDNFEFVDINS